MKKYTLVLILLSLTGCSFGVRDLSERSYELGCLRSMQRIYKNEYHPTLEQIDQTVKFCHETSRTFLND